MACSTIVVRFCRPSTSVGDLSAEGNSRRCDRAVGRFRLVEIDCIIYRKLHSGRLNDKPFLDSSRTTYTQSVRAPFKALVCKHLKNIDRGLRFTTNKLDEGSSKYQYPRDPRHDQKAGADGCANTNVISIRIDQLYRLHSDQRNHGSSKA